MKAISSPIRMTPADHKSPFGNMLLFSWPLFHCWVGGVRAAMLEASQAGADALQR